MFAKLFGLLMIVIGIIIYFSTFSDIILQFAIPMWAKIWENNPIVFIGCILMVGFGNFLLFKKEKEG